jgi:uncharacterized protein with beta-barrel porin domain
MNKYLLPLALCLAACNTTETNAPAEAKSADVQIVEQIDNSPQAFFASVQGTASSIEIISNANGTFTVKYTANGTSGELVMKKEPLMAEGKPTVATGEVKLKGDGGSLVIAPATCEGGTHTCTITTADRVIEACGKYAM